MKSIIVAVLSSICLIISSQASANSQEYVTIYSYANGQYVSDINRTKRIKTIGSPFRWKARKISSSSTEIYVNLISSVRSAACIYDSSGSSLAKMDSSCNNNYPRAEWRFEYIRSTSLWGDTFQTKIVSKRGTCLEVDPRRSRLKAVTCVAGNNNQLFEVSKK
jgi:hypothetical protein